MSVLQELAETRILGRLTAMFVILFAMLALYHDMTSEIDIEGNTKELLMLVLGGAIVFIWNTCNETPPCDCNKKK